MIIPKAVGIHVFAGGFTMGVQQVCPVDTHLEVHGFGIDTAHRLTGVDVYNDERGPQGWPDVKDAQWSFGNPRCTAFSTITSGDMYESKNSHGAFAKQTCDILQFCEYSAGRYDVCIWESVQQAYTTGRPLLDHLRDEYFAPKGYRIAHLFINAGSFGNAQQRKRYFFVAYRGDRQFNIMPPEISPYKNCMYDAIYDLRDREVNETKASSDEYTRDTYFQLSDDEKAVVPMLPNGWSLNVFAKYATHLMPEKYQFKWNYRISELPFSLHCIYRTNWLTQAPTLHSSTWRLIHPRHDRPLTIGELSAIMGWPDGAIPVGYDPVKQIVKGIVPDVGRWLAEQVILYFNNHWGNEDWESSFNDQTGTWEGGDANGKIEKTFNLTRFTGKYHDDERYIGLAAPQEHVYDSELRVHRCLVA